MWFSCNFLILGIILLKSSSVILVSQGSNSDNESNSNVLWPLGIVPFYIDKESYDPVIRNRVKVVMDSMEEVSCVRFHQLRTPYNPTPWINISNTDKIRECTHTDANITLSGIKVVFGYECMQHRDILHSLMHALGFKDEVAHPQRDQYIRILWENINPMYHALFHKRYVDFFIKPTEYDPMSVMQFHDRAYSMNGRATIAPVMSGLKIEPSRVLSQLDKLKLRLLFEQECNKRKVDKLLNTCKMALSPRQVGDGSDIEQPEENSSENGDVYSDKPESSDKEESNDKPEPSDKEESNDKPESSDKEESDDEDDKTSDVTHESDNQDDEFIIDSASSPNLPGNFDITKKY